KESDQSASEKTKETNKPKYFYLKLTALYKENDKVQVFYTQSHNEVFSANQVLNKQVQSNPEMQEIVFEMSKVDYPYNIRIDLSDNKDQASIIVKDCILYYGDYSFKIETKDFTKYFNFSAGVEMSSDSTRFNFK